VQSRGSQVFGISDRHQTANQSTPQSSFKLSEIDAASNFIALALKVNQAHAISLSKQLLTQVVGRRTLYMSEIQQLEETVSATVSQQPYRLDQKLHQILYKSPARPILEPLPEPEALPEPPYPLHPDPKEMTKSEYQRLNAFRTWKTWGAPYFKSRWHNKELRPLIP
jgi:hypothetical protein